LSRWAATREHEPDPKERQQCVRLVFEAVAVDAGKVVSVTPREDVLPLFGQQRRVRSARRGHDLINKYLLHGGSSCLEWTLTRRARSQHEQTRREDRQLKFYELRDNLPADSATG